MATGDRVEGRTCLRFCVRSSSAILRAFSSWSRSSRSWDETLSERPSAPAMAVCFSDLD